MKSSKADVLKIKEISQERQILFWFESKVDQIRDVIESDNQVTVETKADGKQRVLSHEEAEMFKLGLQTALDVFGECVQLTLGTEG